MNKLQIFCVTDKPIKNLENLDLNLAGVTDNKFSEKDTKIYLEIRGKKYPANICGLPFYKKNYVKGENKWVTLNFQKSMNG